MKKILIPIPILAPLAAAAIVLTACGAPPVIRDVGPSPSRSAVEQYERERIASEARAMEANAAVGLPPAVDRELAEAAAKDGKPFAFTVDRCSYLRLPDRTLWGLEAGGALTRDTDLEETLAEWRGVLPGCALATGVTPQIPNALDRAAADAANAEGRPYRWHDSCGRAFVRIPGSTDAFTVPATPTTRGEVLSPEVDRRGCGSGVERPTGTGGVR